MSTTTDRELVAQPRPNMELIDQVLDHIIEHPETWDQKSYARENECGTTCCFAGHAVLTVEGNKYVFHENGHDLVNKDGKHLSSFYEGKRVLGLTDIEANELFYYTIRATDEDTLAAVKVTVEEIRYRAKQQDQAFNRIAEEFIDSAALDQVDLNACPESEEIVKGLRGGSQE